MLAQSARTWNTAFFSVGTFLIYFLICTNLPPLATGSIFDSKKKIDKIAQVPPVIVGPSCDCAQPSAEGTGGKESGEFETTTLLVTSTYSYLLSSSAAICTTTAEPLVESKSSCLMTATTSTIEFTTFTMTESITTTRCSFVPSPITVTTTTLLTCSSVAIASTVTVTPKESSVAGGKPVAPPITSVASSLASTDIAQVVDKKPRCTTETTTYVSKSTKCVQTSIDGATKKEADSKVKKEQKPAKPKDSLQDFCTRNMRKERIRTRNLLATHAQQSPSANGSNAQAGCTNPDKSNAHLLMPYPFEPPKECSFMFLRLLRLNIYYYIRDTLNVPVDIDNIRLTNCELQTEIDDDDHSISADVELRNVDAALAPKIEVALERIEPEARAPKFTCTQIKSIEQYIPDIGINAFNCMPMKNRDLEHARMSVSFVRKLLGLLMVGAVVVYAIYGYIQWNQLQRNTSDYFMLV